MHTHSHTHTHTHTHTPKHTASQGSWGWHSGGHLFPVQGFSPQLVQPTLQTEPESPQTNPESSSSDINTLRKGKAGAALQVLAPPKLLRNTSTRMHTGARMHTHCAHVCAHAHAVHTCVQTHTCTHSCTHMQLQKD